MGVVKRQTILNSVVQYAGILLGYYNAVILFTNYLDTEQYGLTRVIMAIAILYMNVGSLGAHKVLLRFFPYFRTEDSRHKGFVLFASLLASAGFVVTTLLYFLLKGPITSAYSDSPLFTSYYAYVVLASFTMLFSNILENYMMARKKTVMTHFLRNILTRLIWIIQIILYHHGFIDFDLFIFLYSSSYFVNFLIMLVIEISTGDLRFTLDFLKIRFRVVKVLVNYGLFSIVTGISTLLTNRIDVIMISFMLGLTPTSIYSIAFYISSVVLVPSTSIYRIAMPVVADQWKKRDFPGMSRFYRKSSLTLTIIGGYVFICIWCCIDDLFLFLKPEYAEGKWIVFILSISVLVGLVAGINGVIISITKYFRYDTYASISLGILAILTNMLLIPLWGLEGAAIATLISVTAYQVYKLILVRVKLNMQPFTSNTLLAIFLLIITYFAVFLIPEIPGGATVRILFRCSLITVILFALLRFLNVSEDISEEIDKYLARVGIRLPF